MDTITINPLHLQNGPQNLKEDHFLTQKPPSELFITALMDQDRSFIFRIFAGFSYVHSAKGDFKSSLMNSTEGGFWFIVIVSAPIYHANFKYVIR